MSASPCSGNGGRKTAWEGGRAGEQESLDNGKRGTENLRAQTKQANRSDPSRCYLCCWDTHTEPCFLHWKGRSKGVSFDPTAVCLLCGWHCTGAWSIFKCREPREMSKHVRGWRVPWPGLAHGSQRAQRGRMWWLDTSPLAQIGQIRLNQNMALQAQQLYSVSLLFCAAHGIQY